MLEFSLFEYEIVGEILSIPKFNKKWFILLCYKKNKKNEYFMKCLNNENIFMIDQKKICDNFKRRKILFPSLFT